MKSVKISVSVDEELLQKIDKYSKEHYISRSAMISLGAGQLILQDEVVKTLSVMRDVLTKISKETELSDETAAQLKQFEILCDSITHSQR